MKYISIDMITKIQEKMNEKRIFQGENWIFHSDWYIKAVIKNFEFENEQIDNFLDDLKLNIMKINLIEEINPLFNKSIFNLRIN